MGRGQRREKRYIALFVCHSSRAVHLEVLHSLTTDSYINGFMRFIARRGEVKQLVLDQGTNLRGSERELTKALREWNEADVEKKFQQIGTEFRFLPPKASMAAGATERIVRSLRSHLRHVLDRQVLGEEVFQTVVTECEKILNHRPLIAASDDVEDCRALTPCDLLHARPGSGLPPGLFGDDDSVVVRFQRQWKQVQVVANSFWKRFRSEYLPLLHQRQKWLKPRRDFAIGDLVLVHDANAPRSAWPMARITAIEPSEDGHIRIVEVQTANRRRYQRPISKIYLLEGAL